MYLLSKLIKQAGLDVPFEMNNEKEFEVQDPTFLIVISC